MQPCDLEYLEQELLEDHTFFIRGQAAVLGGAPASVNARAEELEVEVAKLKEQLGKAKAINDTMWQSVVHKLMEDGERSNADGEQQRGRKRTRV